MGDPDASMPQPPSVLPSALAGRRRWGRRRPGWVAAAAVLMVFGVVGSALAAVSVARNGASDSRRALRSSAADIALTLQLAIQHERDLIASASGFVITNPDATNAQFALWAHSVHALARYPELADLGHSVIVPAADLVVRPASVVPV